MLRELKTRADRRAFLLNLICFAACVEGLFFYGAFAYVYYLRSGGLLYRLTSGTNWVFRDESTHMAFRVRRGRDRPDRKTRPVRRGDGTRGARHARRGSGVRDPIRRRRARARRLRDVAQRHAEYLQHVADRRFAVLEIEPLYGNQKPVRPSRSYRTSKTVQLLRTPGVPTRWA
jgi:ribonucleoside-diphosphate reductase beta chain